MATHVTGDNDLSSVPNGVHRQFRRLYAAHRWSEQLLSQVPDADDYRHEDLPPPLARLLGRYGCNVIFNVIEACLIRLLTESTVPPSVADSRTSRQPGRQPAD